MVAKTVSLASSPKLSPNDENARAASSTKPADVGVNVHDTSGTSTDSDNASELDCFSTPRTAPTESKAGTLIGSAWIMGRRFIASYDRRGCKATIHSYSSGSVGASLTLCTLKPVRHAGGWSPVDTADARGRRVRKFVAPNASKSPLPSLYPFMTSPRLGDGTNIDASAMFTAKTPG